MITRRTPHLRRCLLAGSAPAALLLALPLSLSGAQPVYAQQEDEINRYTMRILTQTFDGERENSHSQAVGYARMRRGDESWIELNFGNGAMVIERQGRTSVGRFKNTSGVEAGLRYDYKTRMLRGGSEPVSSFHNTFVSRQLGKGPALGLDAKWTALMLPSDLGLAAKADSPFAIELSRQYFSHGGRDYVLLRYKVPAFTYAANGQQVVHWGEGAALTDPGFGNMYWNAALHRAVRDEPGGQDRPYRHSKTMLALDAKGKPVIDPRKIPQTAALVETFCGASNNEVIGFVKGAVPDRTPLQLANAIDIMALSIAEDSPNQLGEVTSQATNGANGAIEMQPDNSLRDAALDTGDLAINVLDTAVAAAAAGTAQPEQFEIILRVVEDYAARGAQLGEELKAAQREYTRMSALIDATGTNDKHVFTDMGKAAFDEMKRAEVALDDARTAHAIADKAVEPVRVAEADVRWAQQTIVAAEAEGATVSETMRQTLANAQRRLEEAQRTLANAEDVATQVGDIRQLEQQYARTQSAISALQDAKAYSVSVPSAATKAQIEKLKVIAQRVGDLNRQIVEYGKLGTVYAATIQKLPVSKFAELVERFQASAAGKVLEGAAHSLNALNVANALMNLGNAVGNDQSRGQLNLSYAYVDISDPFNLTNAGKILRGVGLDMIGMVSSGLSGDAVGFFSDAAVVATSSVTDLIVSIKGVQDINRLERELTEESGRMYTQRFLDNERKLREFYESIDAHIATARQEIADLDAEFARARTMALQMLEERRRRREEAERQGNGRSNWPAPKTSDSIRNGSSVRRRLKNGPNSTPILPRRSSLTTRQHLRRRLSRSKHGCSRPKRNGGRRLKRRRRLSQLRRPRQSDWPKSKRKRHGTSRLLRKKHSADVMKKRWRVSRGWRRRGTAS